MIVDISQAGGALKIFQSLDDDYDYVGMVGTDDVGTDDVGTDNVGTDDVGTGDVGTGDVGTGDVRTQGGGTLVIVPWDKSWWYYSIGSLRVRYAVKK